MFVAEMNQMLDRLDVEDNCYVIAALYQFVSLKQLDVLRQQLQQLCDKNEALGTILLASEGINGTVAAPRNGMARFLEWLELDGRFDNLSLKFSCSPDQPFLRMKVRPKREIVTMGRPEINPAKRTGTHIDPADWNKLISDPDVLLIDTRNTYETAIGMFDGAVDPMTKNFRDFPDWAHELATQREDRRPKKIAMYCTGGIRCERSTAYLKKKGFKDVYHLKGGILRYLEKMPQDQSLWEGDCFVFDYRVAVDHELKPAKWKIDPETGDPERMSDDEIEKIADRRRSGAIFNKPYTV